MSAGPALDSLAPQDCWNRIGVSGDSSCEKLAAAIHCRNCPVFREAGRQLLDRSAPGDYVSQWSERIAVRAASADPEAHSAVLFRIGSEWFALSTHCCVEVTEPRPIHQIPHGRGPILAGLVNIRGRLEICVSIANLLHAPKAPSVATPAKPTRLVVIERNRKRWAFPADEVYGVHHFSDRQLSSVPITIDRAEVRHSRGVIQWEDRRVGLLDPDKLFDALDAGIS
jgi:chemotaxis-related protein WspD